LGIKYLAENPMYNKFAKHTLISDCNRMIIVD